MPENGKVYFVGAGPGDPELLTVKALRLLMQSDAVVYDSLITDEIMSFVPPGVERIAIRSSPREKGMSVAEMAEVSGRRALEGKIVVRLKSGDPLVFSRLGEEIDFLEGLGVDYEIVPGISSAFFSAAASGTMLTDRRYSSTFAIVTGHEAKEKSSRQIDWELLGKAVDVIVVLMGATNLRDYCWKLRNAGLDGKCTVTLVGNASRGNETVASITLDEACEGSVEVPSDLCTVIISKNKIASHQRDETAISVMETA